MKANDMDYISSCSTRHGHVQIEEIISTRVIVIYGGCIIKAGGANSKQRTGYLYQPSQTDEMNLFVPIKPSEKQKGKSHFLNSLLSINEIQNTKPNIPIVAQYNPVISQPKYKKKKKASFTEALPREEQLPAFHTKLLPAARACGFLQKPTVVPSLPSSGQGCTLSQAAKEGIVKVQPMSAVILIEMRKWICKNREGF